MLKVMINISGKDVPEVCEGVFEDMSEDDWGCKYAEVALKNGYIAANSEFRPDDNVSKVEALKFIMQAKDIPRDTNDDWRAGYVSRALSEDILSDSFDDYDSASFRGWIFVTATNTYGDQSTSEPKDNTEPQTLEEDFLSPEDEELLEHFLNI